MDRVHALKAERENTMKISARLTRAAILILAGVGLFAAASCSRSEPAPAAASGTPPYNVDMDMTELMVHVMEPGAYAFWKGWGIIYTPDGTFDISPRTEQEWIQVENGAATVIAATNILMTAPYTRDPQDEWFQAAKAVADIAKAGKDAAEKQDKQAMYELGSKLDEACDACHEKFQE
jgi:hypothetical protein